MALALVPLLWLDVATQFSLVAVWLLVHAICAATQDISIDALCVQQSQPDERAALNGWMQCGVLVGRAVMGGGALVLEHWIGFPAVVVLLIAIVLGTSALLLGAKETPCESGQKESGTQFGLKDRMSAMMAVFGSALKSRAVWCGLLFALLAPAAFKSLEAIIGPFLIDRGYSELQVGKFTATVMIGGMIAGSLLAGRLAGSIKGSRFVACALCANLVAISLLAISDHLGGGAASWQLLVILGLVSITIGWFTVALYQWLMNLTNSLLAATQFTAFMAATNACEAWSTAAFGMLQVRWGYPATMLVICTLSGVGGLLILKAASSKIAAD